MTNYQGYDRNVGVLLRDPKSTIFEEIKNALKEKKIVLVVRPSISSTKNGSLCSKSLSDTSSERGQLNNQ